MGKSIHNWISLWDYCHEKEFGETKSYLEFCKNLKKPKNLINIDGDMVPDMLVATDEFKSANTKLTQTADEIMDLAKNTENVFLGVRLKSWISPRRINKDKENIPLEFMRRKSPSPSYCLATNAIKCGETKWVQIDVDKNLIEGRFKSLQSKCSKSILKSKSPTQEICIGIIGELIAERGELKSGSEDWLKNTHLYDAVWDMWREQYDQDKPPSLSALKDYYKEFKKRREINSS